MSVRALDNLNIVPEYDHNTWTVATADLRVNAVGDLVVAAVAAVRIGQVGFEMFSVAVLK